MLSRRPEAKSIGIFYGAAHMKEIQAALESTYGYKSVRTEWITFATADRKRLGETEKMMLQMMGAAKK